jgi:CheY-like chemotaxis protein
VSADDVLAVLQAGTKVDVILTEVQLAGSLDGFGLARQIRENNHEIDVILTSGVARAADKAGDLCDDGPWKSRITRRRSFGAFTSCASGGEHP